MFFGNGGEGMSFQEANAELGSGDFVDITVATAFGAASGIIDNGIGQLVSWVSKPRNRKILTTLFNVGVDVLETAFKESFKGTKYEDLDLLSIFASSLTEVGLGEFLSPDIIKRSVKQTSNNAKVASKRVKDLKSRKKQNNRLIKNAEKTASTKNKMNVANTVAGITKESAVKTTANQVQEKTSDED